MSRHFTRLGYVSAAVLLFSGLAFSQAQTGSLSGTVLDANDAAIAAAAVDAREMNTGVTAHTVSSDAGVYVFPNLPTGMWSISAEKPGFKKTRKDRHRDLYRPTAGARSQARAR